MSLTRISQPEKDATQAGGAGWRARCGAELRRLLAHPRLPWLAAGLAILLTLPSIGGGLIGDDYHHKLLMQRSNSIVRLMDSPWDMFRFFTGGPQGIRRLMDYGAVPWWTYEHIRGAFWRPVASLTHWADYLLWPNRPALMHVQSILWYALVAGVVAFFYRRFMGPGLAAGLATILYVIDDAHGTPVGFLSNRSDLPAIVFGVLCLMAHDRWRRERWRLGALLAPVLLALSLLSKEAGIATCAYLAAYELFLDRGSRGGRLLSLLAYGVVLVGWRACWTHLGYGVAELGLYIDPVTQPGRYLAGLPSRMLMLLWGQWGAPPPDAFMLMGETATPFLLAGSAILILALAALFVPLIRREPLARFWAAGMFLSLLPSCATFVSDRLLMFAGLGAAGLLAQWLARPRAGISTTWFARGMAGLLITIHLILAPLLLPLRAGWPVGPKSLQDQFWFTRPMDAAIRSQDLIVVNPPESFVMLVNLLAWASEDAPMPRHMRLLTSGHFQPVEVYRADERTLSVRPSAGYLAGTLDVLFRGPWRPFALHDQVTLEGMTVRITELLPDGRPAEAAFTFEVPLEDASLYWLYWQKGKFLPFVPPAVGRRVTLNAKASL